MTSPTVRDLLAEMRDMRRTGKRRDGLVVGPILAARLPKLIAGIVAVLKLGAQDRRVSP